MTALLPDTQHQSPCAFCSKVRSIARMLPLPIGPRLLLDVRETSVWRGYHLLAAAALMTPYLGRCRLYALSTGHPEEQLAMDVFQFDSGRKLALWQPPKRRWWRRPVFDLYLMISDEWPKKDPLTKQARRGSKRFLLGLRCPGAPRPGKAMIVNGSDTRAYAAKVLELLGRSSGPRP
jgi:hypothetical protein